MAAIGAQAVTLTRHPDGRHAVLDENGYLLGLHNSLSSAQRQMKDYYPEQMQEQAQPKMQSLSAPAAGGAMPAPAAPAPAAAPAVNIGTAAHTPTPQDMAAGMNYAKAVMTGKANFPMGRMP